MRDEVKVLIDAIEETAKGRTRMEHTNVVIALISNGITNEQRQKNESDRTAQELIDSINNLITILDSLNTMDPSFKGTYVYNNVVEIKEPLKKVVKELTVTSVNFECKKRVQEILPGLGNKIVALASKLEKKASRNDADLALLKLINESDRAVGDLRKLINDLKQFAGPFQKITTLD